MHDASLTILACMSTATGQLLPAMTSQAWVFVAGGVISGLSPAATVAVRAMTSRCVADDEVIAC